MKKEKPIKQNNMEAMGPGIVMASLFPSPKSDLNKL
jgi:hypothetical protein